MTLPAWRDWVFALKVCAAALLALFVALWIDLPRPYWAVSTVFITIQPLAGATRSKAIYRVYGTIRLGADRIGAGLGAAARAGLDRLQRAGPGDRKVVAQLTTYGEEDVAHPLRTGPIGYRIRRRR